MRQLQSLLASAALTLALAATAAAGDGIIHTGLTPPPPPPPPATTSSVADETASGGETAEGEATALDSIVEAALNCLQGTLALF